MRAQSATYQQGLNVTTGFPSVKPYTGPRSDPVKFTFDIPSSAMLAVVRPTIYITPFYAAGAAGTAAEIVKYTSVGKHTQTTVNTG